jgi:hypothetical protein
MILPFFILAEYVRLTRPIAQRLDLGSVRACRSVLRFTFGTTQPTAAAGACGEGGVVDGAAARAQRPPL